MLLRWWNNHSNKGQEGANGAGVAGGETDAVIDEVAESLSSIRIPSSLEDPFKDLEPTSF